MTREEKEISVLYGIRADNFNLDDAYTKDKYDALTLAIETMRKYQKIQEIVKQKDYDRFNSHNYYGDFLRVQDIRKVIEDGRNNLHINRN